MKNIYLIDASGYLYKSYFAIPPMTSSKGQSVNALYGFVRSMSKLFKDFAPTHIAAIFDGKDNKRARRKIYPEYKANRAAIAPDLPQQISWAQDFCSLSNIPMLAVEGVEADDTIGSIALWAEKEGFRVYICTSDKDLFQLVSDNIMIINTHKDNLIIDGADVEKRYGITPKQFIDYLAITGDTSDNIPGIRGFGPKTAATLLKQFGTLEGILENPDKISGKKKQETIVNEADIARLSKQLVTIDTSVDFQHNDTFFTYGKSPNVRNLKEFFLSFNFRSFVRELDDEKDDIKVSYQLVDDDASLISLIEDLETTTEICFDIKATDSNPIRAELVGIGFCIKHGKAWYIPANGALGIATVLKALKPLFANPSIGFYGHNIKYDAQVLSNYGITIKNICFDTMLASYLLNAHSRQHSLNALIVNYFGRTKISIEDLIGKGKKQKNMADVDINAVCAYCCEDVDYTCRLKSILEEELKNRNLRNLLSDIELPLIPVLAKMERSGVYLNIATLSGMSQSFAHNIDTLEREIFDMSGETFNVNSPKQLGYILFEKLEIPPPKKTTTGSFSTNADVLEILKDSYPIAKKVLEYRSLEKLRSTYIDALPDDVNSETNRIHCTFNQSVAATGRLSCQNPNLQNIPIRSKEGRKIRGAFQPEQSGWSFLSGDYSQIELRILAHLSDDPGLIKAFNNNEDIHSFTASLVLGIPLDKITKEQRQHAKAVNFGIIYGQQAFGLARELNISISRASEFIEAYFNRYKRVKEFLEECKEQARKTGKTTTMLGRERLIPEIGSTNASIRIAAERLAINTPLQGTAADLIKLAMIQMDKNLSNKAMSGSMILQIHDELLFEFPDHERDKLKNLVKDTMENIYKLKIPLTVDIAIGKNWEEC